jgi:CRP-like cAMP-binding protein
VGSIEALERSVLFGRLPRDRLEALGRDLVRRRYPTGHHLYREGDAAVGLWLIVRGRVHVLRVDPDGNDLVLHVWLPGDTVGEPALFGHDRVRRASACAVEPTECLYMEREAVVGFLEREPVAMRGMLERLSDILFDHNAQLAQLAFYDIAGRLARTLLELAGSSGARDRDGIRIDLPLTQRTLAGLVSATRENVNRALAKLAAEKLIRLDGAHVVILDAARLAERFGIDGGR